jgi:hypothetical protein
MDTLPAESLEAMSFRVVCEMVQRVESVSATGP